MSAPVRDRVGELLGRPGAGLLLDLDGTLVDSEPMQRAAFRTYFARRGWDVPERVIRRFMGRRGADAFAALDGPWRGEDPVRLTAEVLACLDPAAHPPVPVPGAAEAVLGWRRRGVPVAVVTSALRPWAAQALRLLGAQDAGVVLVTSEESPAGKPDPGPYRLGAERLGVAPAGCVAVEDAAPGVVSARAAGVGLVLGVATTLDDADLREAGADAVVTDLTPIAPREEP